MRGSSAACGADSLRLQLGVPVEEVGPAFVQVVRREAPAGALHLLGRGLVRRAAEGEARLFERLVGLPQVAGRTGGHATLSQAVTPPRDRGTT